MGLDAPCRDGVRPGALTLAAWRGVFGDRVLMAMVLVTALSGAGQFTLFSYFAPYFKHAVGASTGEITLLFVWFGVFGVVGNALASRYIDRIGADRAVGFTLVLMALSLLAWPLAGSVVVAGAGPRAVGPRLLLVAIDAAGAPRRRRAGCSRRR